MHSVKFASNTKFRETVDRLEGRDAIQRELDGLEKWVKSNLMKYKGYTCRVLHLERNSIIQPH